MNNGLHFDIPMQDYLDFDAISSSALKIILRSPKDYIAAKNQKRKETPAQAFGTAVHTALEFIHTPSEFERRYLLTSEDWGPRNKGIGYAKWKEAQLQADLEGKICLSYEDSLKVQQILEAAKNHKGLMQILSSGNPEVTGVCNIPESNLRLKARTDWLSSVRDGEVYELWDIKTTSAEMNDNSLHYEVQKFGYHFQAAFHMEIIGNYRPVTDFGWIFISTNTPAPHIFTRTISRRLLQYARQDLAQALELIRECTESNEWPGLDEEIRILEPVWKSNENIMPMNPWENEPNREGI